MLIGLAGYAAFSTLQAPNGARSKDVSAYRAARANVVQHVNFVVELCREQIGDGHCVLHGHLRWATPRKLPQVGKPIAIPEVGVSHGHECQYGAGAQRVAKHGSPILKPTRFFSNSAKVLGELSRQSPGMDGYCSSPPACRSARQTRQLHLQTCPRCSSLP